MTELFPNPSLRARAARSWLRTPITSFLSWLVERRYHPGTLLLCVRRLLAFSEFTDSQAVADLTTLPDWVEPYLRQLQATDLHRTKTRLALRRFFDHLRHIRLLPAVPPPPALPHQHLVEDYLHTLRQQRGLCEDSLYLIRSPCQGLFCFAADEGIDAPSELTAACIHRFVVSLGRRCGRSTLQSRCTYLRHFLAYLHRRKVIPIDLGAAILAPRVYRQEQCPRYLTRTQIDSVLAAVDRDAPLGCRDYAMLMLLAVYGLRGCEVVHLRLDDIDWRSQLLHVRRRKAGNSTTYPLSDSVGSAVVAYLRQVRPADVAHREVFLTSNAPFKPLASGDVLANRVRAYLGLAGITLHKAGCHCFRYSCAQRLFEQGAPLKLIGDYLGHRDTDSTQVYTKIAVDQLRDIAAGSEEGLL